MYTLSVIHTSWVIRGGSDVLFVVAARLEHEALVTVQREEEERARRDELQRKIKNAQDTVSTHVI